MIRAAAIIVLCGAACASFAQTPKLPAKSSAGLLIWEPPAFPAMGFIAVKPTVRKQMITSIRISDMSIVLEETQLEAARARFGGEAGARGDAGDALLWLCLHGNDSIGPWVLWLTSGEVDGPYIGSFRWQRVASAAQFDRRCQMLGDADSNVALPLDIGLGTDEDKVLQILGRPTLRKGDTLRYEHEHNLTLRSEPWTSFNRVIVILRHGVVWALDVYKTTQY